MTFRAQIGRDLRPVLEKLDLSAKDIDIDIVRSMGKSHGDYSSNIALKLASKGKHSPIEIANKISRSIRVLPYVVKLEVAEPGFINFYVKDEEWQKRVNEVLDKGHDFGSNELGKGKKARVEFVSANPTGPLHFGNARGGPIGDVLASVLEFNGYEVIREYYHNDVGGQVAKLGESILNVINGKNLEDQEYKGEYINELAARVRNSKSGLQVSGTIGKQAVEILLLEIINDCKQMGIKFNEVYKESELVGSGKTKNSIEKIGKFLKKNEGATWFAPSDEFLKDRETVVVKSDGSFTYFANDIAYHDLKFEDKPDLVIDILGANHHGHIPRLQAAVSALGYDVSRFHVILYQWVRFKRGGEALKMSKRSGTFITAREVLEAVGMDAVRFFILMHDSSSPIDFDMDLAREKSTKNPVYYVQYAHARIASILDKLDVEPEMLKVQKGTDLHLLSTEYELNLIKQITRFPELVEDISKSFAVHQLTTYATDLADTFHKFYENCRVVGEQKELVDARLRLAMATKITLVNTLGLLGISAPDKM